MDDNFSDIPIEFLKGVGPQRAELLRNESNIYKFGDLLTYYPFRYVDRSKFYKISELNDDLPYVQLIGKIIDIELLGKNTSSRLVANFTDGTGIIELIWFKGIKWIKDSIKKNTLYIVFGKATSFKGIFNIAHPEIELANDENLKIISSLQPVYNSTEKLKSKGLDSKGISKLIRQLFNHPDFYLHETLNKNLINNLKFISKREALINIHLPKNFEYLIQAQRRLKFEELFFIQLKILRQQYDRKNYIKGYVFDKVGNYFNSFYNNNLKFELTNAQKRVIKEIRFDFKSGKQMNRLLQGDVGSGKTLVALMVMLIALDNNFQACLMAPTEILAIQHFNTISKFLNGLDIYISLLTGSTKSSQRKIISENLQNGSLQILIGTHALIEDNVQFKSLGISVIDEQHRFGVEQRSKLWKKSSAYPHVLVMTATPIPRTLAMTLYGDLDVSIIDELPPGRKPIKTIHKYDSSRLRVFGFMKEQISKGRQVYVVYPLINESETLDLKHLMDGYDSITKEFPLPEYAVSIVHGQMKPADKDYEMDRFKRGETQIMVATTVIEVGVDVPNASVMIIENAERFGLAQLHQLRGRVGRGNDQSYCILMTSDKLSTDGKVRIETMVKTNDGFEIADVDLKLRGPGNIEGTQQSGVLDLKLADLSKDAQMLQYARKIASEILNDDPDLNKEDNLILKRQLNLLNKNRKNWSLIS
ncbi:MAG: ATP-dependent DNA helicase RecG [Bacteroidota bacterium]|nr:ATP-dependent DNA helicase RecG [Bacteroidota bacterium]